MTPGEEILKIAIGELGTKESPKDSNRVKYNTWYYGREVSGSAYPWCMAFVQWCCDRAGWPLPFKTASCSALLAWYKANAPERIVAEPDKGDVVIYGFGHTGICESAAANTVTVIEGNTSLTSASNGGEVMRCTRARSTVAGFIHPFDEAEPEEDDGRIHSVEDAPEWAREELQRLIDRGALKGGDGGDLDLSADMLRVLIVCQRMVDGR